MPLAVWWQVIPSSPLETALPRLAAALDHAFGPAGEAIGVAVRSVPGVLERLVAAVECGAELRFAALHILANVSSNAVDAASAETKRALLSVPGCAETLFDQLTDPDVPLVVRVAVAACLQNLCSDAAWVFVLSHEVELLADLEATCTHPSSDPRLVHYILGALANAAQAAAATAGCNLTLQESTWRLVRWRREATEQTRIKEHQATEKLGRAVASVRQRLRASKSDAADSSDSGTERIIAVSPATFLPPVVSPMSLQRSQHTTGEAPEAPHLVAEPSPRTLRLSGPSAGSRSPRLLDASSRNKVRAAPVTSATPRFVSPVVKERSPDGDGSTFPSSSPPKWPTVEKVPVTVPRVSARLAFLSRPVAASRHCNANGRQPSPSTTSTMLPTLAPSERELCELRFTPALGAAARPR